MTKHSVLLTIVIPMLVSACHSGAAASARPTSSVAPATPTPLAAPTPASAVPTIQATVPPTAGLSPNSAADRHARLSQVSHWLYLISANLSAQTVDQIAASTHNLVVLDFIPSE